jgi:hypothetical protein
MIDYLVDHSHVLAGERRSFDEAATRRLICHEVKRARDFTAPRKG